MRKNAAIPQSLGSIFIQILRSVVTRISTLRQNRWGVSELNFRDSLPFFYFIDKRLINSIFKRINSSSYAAITAPFHLVLYEPQP